MKKLVLSCITIVFALLISGSLKAQKEKPSTSATNAVNTISDRSYGIHSYMNTRTTKRMVIIGKIKTV